MGKNNKNVPVQAEEIKKERQLTTYNIHDWARNIAVESKRYVREGGNEQLKEITIYRQGDFKRFFSEKTTISIDEGFLFNSASKHTGDPLDFIKSCGLIVDDPDNGVYDFSDLQSLEGLHKFAVSEIFLVLAAFLDPDKRIL